MCGIAGFYSSKGIDSSFLKKMTDSIVHRGPDDEGFVFWEALSSPTPHVDNFAARVQLGLGHRRLSILDISSAGHQPMGFLNQRYWITYNGEIYNYLELKDELESLGHVFSSKCDTEVILASYVQWGEACQDKFNGMWAFALYDCLEQTLFISRDRFGIKPLYYWVSPEGNFYFGSEIKEFTVLEGWSPCLNHRRAYDFLVYGIMDHTDETLFEGVFQCSPGHCALMELKQDLFCSGERIKLKQWYTELDNITEQSALSFQDTGDRFRQLFGDSIALHLRADVPVGSCLSGGLDSSSIVCLMNKIMRESDVTTLQKTFSALSHDENINEKKWIDIVTQHTKVEAYSVYPEPDKLFNNLHKITWHMDEPFGSASIFAQWSVFSLAKAQSVAVMLDGQGADEILAGYRNFFGARLSELFKAGSLLKLVKEATFIQKNHKYGWKRIIGQFFDCLLPYNIKASLGKTNTDGFPRWLNRQFFMNALSDPFVFDRSGVRAMSLAQIKGLNLQMLLHWEDRASMAHSVESRVPFLDYRLVEYAVALPSEYKISNGVTKRVLREAMDGILPEEIKDRMDKIGFATEEESWLKYKRPEIFRDRIQSAITDTEGFITSDALEYFDDVVAGKKRFDFKLWRIISFAEWVRVFKVNIEKVAP